MVSTRGITLLSILISISSLSIASELYPAYLMNRQAAGLSTDVCPNTIWVTASQSVSTVYVTESGSEVYITTGTVPTVTSTITVCPLSSSGPQNQAQPDISTQVIDIYETVTNELGVTVVHVNVATINSIDVQQVTSVITEEFTTVIQVLAPSPSCSITAPVILNSDFEDPIGGEWQFSSVGGAVTGEQSSLYMNTGSKSYVMTFPGNSLRTTIGTLSQKISVCPGQRYALSMSVSVVAPVPPICKVFLCAVPEIGPSTCSITPIRILQGTGYTDETILFDNLDLGSNYAVVTLNAECDSRGTTAGGQVSFDTILVAQDNGVTTV